MGFELVAVFQQFGKSTLQNSNVGRQNKYYTLHVYPLQAYKTATELTFSNLRGEAPAGQGRTR
jgi:hypothetical protein